MKLLRHFINIHYLDIFISLNIPNWYYTRLYEISSSSEVKFITFLKFHLVLIEIYSKSHH